MKNMQEGSIYNPTSQSLEARTQAAKVALQALRDAEASLTHTQTTGYDSAMGTEAELQAAFTLIRGSLDEAIRQLSLSELNQARETTLLTAEEHLILTNEKNLASMQAVRQQHAEYERDRGSDHEPGS